MDEEAGGAAVCCAVRGDDVELAQATSTPVGIHYGNWSKSASCGRETDGHVGGVGILVEILIEGVIVVLRPCSVSFLADPDVAVVVDLSIDLDGVGSVDRSLEVAVEDECFVSGVV